MSDITKIISTKHNSDTVNIEKIVDINFPNKDKPGAHIHYPVIIGPINIPQRNFVYVKDLINKPLVDQIKTDLPNNTTATIYPPKLTYQFNTLHWLEPNKTGNKVLETIIDTPIKQEKDIQPTLDHQKTQIIEQPKAPPIKQIYESPKKTIVNKKKVIITDRDDGILFNESKVSEAITKNILVYVYSSLENLMRRISEQYHDMLMTFHDKIKFNQFMVDNGLEINIPTLLPKPPNYFPCIVKPSINSSGNDMFIIKDYSDWNTLGHKFNSNHYFIQKYIISNTIYTSHLLSKNGEYLIGSTYKSVKPTKFYIQRASIKNYTRRNLNDTEIELFSKILKLNNYHGVCCVNYDYDENNVIKIFEINPRFGGSLINNESDFLLFLKTINDNDIMYI